MNLMSRFPILSAFILSIATLAPAPRALAQDQHDHGGIHPAGSGYCLAITNLPPFLDPLPIPPVAVPARTNYNYCVPVVPGQCYTNGIPEYDMPMIPLPQYFHAKLPPVELWGYAGSVPGPTFDVTAGSPILVNWINQLPTNYPDWLPANPFLHGVPDQSVRTVVHLHGGATLPRYDGYPTNWYRTGQSDQYFYGNVDLGGKGQSLWYHDHAIGVTANNVYVGLAGLYILRNPAVETNLNLPAGPYEVPLAIRDLDIQTNCAPQSILLTTYPWHSLVAVNGKITPYLEVEPRRYRFRILNAAGSRAFGLALAVTDDQGNSLTNAPVPPPYHIIGNDDGFLQKTVTQSSTNGLALGEAERVDMIIDFTQFTNRSITMFNTIATPLPPFVTNIMQFRVTLPLSSPDTSSIPGTIISNWVTTASMTNNVDVNREIALDLTIETPFPGPPFEADGSGPFSLLNLSHFDAPITERPRAGQREIWSFINLSSDMHPMHIHLLSFRVLDRIRFAGWNTNQNLAFPPTMVTNYINDRIAGTLKPLAYYLSTNTNDIQTVKAFESGDKDTVRAAPYSVTRVVMEWPTNTDYYTTPSALSLAADTDGRYVYHCHILDHEDDDMMRPLQLFAPEGPRLLTVLDAAANPGGLNHFKLRLNTRAGKTYRVETTTDAAGKNWSVLPQNEVIGTGGAVDITLPVSQDLTRFYRVEIVSAP